ncbi:MAG: Mur ligase family protein, partial [Rhodococcus sp.]
MTEASTDLSWLRGSSVLVTGARISGLAVVRPLLDLGALVTVTDSNRAALDEASALGAAMVVQDDLLADPDAIAAFALVVTSPGFRPDSPVLAAAADHDVPVWGDVEFSWHLDRAEVYGPRARWLVVTGTNGKTTTTSMLASILDTAGIDSVACGNIGLPIADALRGTPHPRVLAVELSSFQ